MRTAWWWFKAWLAYSRASGKVLRLKSGQVYRQTDPAETFDFVWAHNATIEVLDRFYCTGQLYMTGVTYRIYRAGESQ
jgi:hypothetical protein